ncbi:phosphatidylinositol-glycan biosynthesis class X protein isoform X2 [Amborella trichopoda]|nr:phosphatidylinositol-glycan biosynthesis class X protein isoform X2 [Amborella trichopoda]XP_020523700.1 phosphatidylinositol-glycan biosynthesis class X protein isoform X2 [Amborella trichopoda]|eukprot:XP_011623873.1 phosphatidylinositol-glycan biosynthesis class X protein isoform X2 [Amborella trichopoda]
MASHHRIHISCSSLRGFISFLISASLVICVAVPSYATEVNGTYATTYFHESSTSTLVCCLPSSEKLLIDYAMRKHGFPLDSVIYGSTIVPNIGSQEPCKQMELNLGSILSLRTLRRQLIGQGSHRQLASSIVFDIQANGPDQLRVHSCELVLIQRLQSGVFADPFELQHLVRRGVFVDVGVFGDTNLELPSAHSGQSVIEVHVSIDWDSILARQKRELEIAVELPLHARYPPIGEDSHATVEIVLSDSIICCKRGSIDDKECSWFGGAEATTSDVVQWRVPCGNEVHSVYVSTITALSASLSALVIVYASLYASKSK